MIILYIELHAKDYVNSLGSQCNYQESAYMTIVNRKQNRKDKNRLKTVLEVKRLNVNDMIDEQEELEQQKDEDDINIRSIEKKHVFKVYNFYGFPFCFYCSNFMFGIISQGVKCQDCDFIAHRKCSEKVPNDCCPDSALIQRLFGIDLTTYVKAYNTPRPFIIDYCIKEIENRGLHTEGLYRVSGFQDDINLIKDRLEQNWLTAEQILKECDDVHVITGVLKLYLRLLPVPLIAYDAYPYLIEAIKKSTESERIAAIRDAIENHLPPAHLQTLKFLMNHLHQLSCQSEINLMSVYNLATVFTPTIVRTPNIGLNNFQMDSWTNEVNLVEMMINYSGKIFK